MSWVMYLPFGETLTAKWPARFTRLRFRSIALKLSGVLSLPRQWRRGKMSDHTKKDSGKREWTYLISEWIILINFHWDRLTRSFPPRWMMIMHGGRRKSICNWTVDCSWGQCIPDLPSHTIVLLVPRLGLELVAAASPAWVTNESPIIHISEKNSKIKTSLTNKAMACARRCCPHKKLRSNVSSYRFRAPPAKLHNFLSSYPHCCQICGPPNSEWVWGII